MFRNRAPGPAVLADPGYSQVVPDRLPVDALADGDRFADPEYRPSYGTEAC